MVNENKKKKRRDSTEKFLVDPEIAIFDELQEINDALEDVADIFKDTDVEKLEQLKGEKGDKGDNGKDGQNGKNGQDGKNGKDGYNGQDGKNGQDGEEGKEGPRGQDGRDGSSDTGLALVQKLMALDPKDRLDIKYLKGLEFLLTKVIQQQGQPSRGIKGIWAGSANPFALIVGSQVAKDVRSITFLGGTMTNRNGDVTIAIPGGQGTIVMSEVVAGSLTTYTLTHTPLAGTPQIYAAGQRLTPTVDYTISGATITTVSSWDAGDILADYEY